MADDSKQDRRNRIEAAAFEVLAEMGYRKASMLQIARRAQASNETLYNWYGSKQALFATIIEENACRLMQVLHDAIAGAGDAPPALDEIGCLLLQFTATPKAVIMTRAAVTDVSETGRLAATIEQHARQVMLGHLGDLFAQMERAGHFDFDGRPQEAVEVYIGLLIGELQMQQALGALPALGEDEIARRSARASQRFDRLFRSRTDPSG